MKIATASLRNGLFITGPIFPAGSPSAAEGTASWLNLMETAATPGEGSADSVFAWNGKQFSPDLTPFGLAARRPMVVKAYTQRENAGPQDMGFDCEVLDSSGAVVTRFELPYAEAQLTNEHLDYLMRIDMQDFPPAAATIRITAADRVNGTRAYCQATIHGAGSWPAPAAVGRLPADEPMGPSAGQTPSDEHGPELVELLEKAVRLVEEYALQLSNIVAEESYVQRSWTGGDNLRDQESASGRIGFSIGTRRLLSDFLTVWLPDSSTWMEFRDVYEVDGKPVREREDRLEALFVAPSPNSNERARAIMDESAQYNLGSIGRDFNMPTFALRVLHPGHVNRFRFKSSGEETIDGIRTCKVDFDETRGPTLVANRETGTDLFSTGSLWLDCSTGRVVQTLFVVAFPKLNIRARIIVQFREDARLGIWVPSRMTELYDRPHTPGSYRVECAAEYTNFRKFQVTVNEKWEPGPGRK